MGFPGGSAVKNLPTMQETWVQSLGWEDTLEKERATYSSIFAWRIPWIEYLVGYSPWGCKESDISLTSLIQIIQCCKNIKYFDVYNSCNPMDCSLSGSSVHGISQAGILEWVAISFSRGSWPRDWTHVSCTAGRFFTDWAIREAIFNIVKTSNSFWVNL